jgi:hypothetical protein
VKPTQNKQLVVEGIDDLRSVIGLMRHHVDWSPDKFKAPVWIILGGGAGPILQPDYIPTLIKDPTIKTLGIMLDADDDANSRYLSFKKLCAEFFPKMPDKLPVNGLVVENHEGKRIGLWIMPDNSSPGAIETFLKFLVPEKTIPLWKHAMKSVADAKGVGANYKECHAEKSNLYTWLAWQDEPGQSAGTALTRKILDPRAESAIPFVKWIMELYQLEHSINLQT